MLAEADWLKSRRDHPGCEAFEEIAPTNYCELPGKRRSFLKYPELSVLRLLLGSLGLQRGLLPVRVVLEDYPALLVLIRPARRSLSHFPGLSVPGPQRKRALHQPAYSLPTKPATTSTRTSTPTPARRTISSMHSPRIRVYEPRLSAYSRGK